MAKCMRSGSAPLCPSARPSISYAPHCCHSQPAAPIYRPSRAAQCAKQHVLRAQRTQHRKSNRRKPDLHRCRAFGFGDEDEGLAGDDEDDENVLPDDEDEQAEEEAGDTLRPSLRLPVRATTCHSLECQHQLPLLTCTRTLGRAEQLSVCSVARSLQDRSCRISSLQQQLLTQRLVIKALLYGCPGCLVLSTAVGCQGRCITCLYRVPLSKSVSTAA